ncbi:MAG: hypothetical protein AMXMBFR13_10020 [Phycisphaerae bacterium]
MKTYRVVLAIVGLLHSAAVAEVTLRNEHLSVVFEESPAGPHLTRIECRDTGSIHDFKHDQQVSLFAVPAEAIHDPALQVHFTPQEDFTFSQMQLAPDNTAATLKFHNELVEVSVRYQMDSDAPVLRKTITCKARSKPAYIAGVRQWSLEPAQDTLIWPKKSALGQPAVVLGKDSGYLLTLEWPRTEVAIENEAICVGYRPGYQLAPGASQEIAAGSILFFKKTFDTDPLEAARHAFFKHVAARVNPQVPCPIKFTTWGPWLREARADRILEIVDDMAYVGTDLLHFDAGWQWPDHPYSRRLPALSNADDGTWDRGVTQPERLPEGLLPLVKAAKARDMDLSLWFDAVGCVFVRETEEWAARDAKGKPLHRGMWENRWPKSPAQSLASTYGDRLRDFVLEAQKRYDLGGVMFDNNNYQVDHALDHRCLANGWDAIDVQLRRIMDIFDAAEQRRPGIYRFFCSAASWPWATLHATHIHSGDPGMSNTMREAVSSDYPARVLAHERRLAWKRHYDNFVPPWGVKGDIAGWSLQQRSAIPVNLAHTEEIISAGEGWAQNMFTCFATTCVRDIRFAFRQMPRYDREILKEWLAWDRGRSGFIFNCRPLFEFLEDPNTGVVGFSHVGDGRGVIYLFNCSFDRADLRLRLDENAGFAPGDAGLKSFIVYPMKARLAHEGLSYGGTLTAAIAPRDCLVIEVGLEPPAEPAPYTDYRQAVTRIRRSFGTYFEAPLDRVIETVEAGRVRLEVGALKGDRILAAQMVDSLGAAVGRRLGLDECLAVPANEATCRLIIGTHDGLSDHAQVGPLFRETLYNRYIEWDEKLVSGPLAIELPESKPPTFCLIAPRPEQLARLAINLSAALGKSGKIAGAEDADTRWTPHSVTAEVPSGRAVLRFRPLMRMTGATPMPNDLSRVRYEIAVERDGKREPIWQEEIAPFFSHVGQAGWWEDRLVSIADLAGQTVSFHFTARHTDGRTEPPMAVGGFERIAVLRLQPTQ